MDVNETVNVEAILHVGAMTVAVMAIIFLISIATPRLAKWVDAWIAKYHSKQEEHPEYMEDTIRSIYELPRRRVAADEEVPPSSEGDETESETETN